MSITKPREVFSLPNVHYAYNCYDTFLSKTRVERKITQSPRVCHY